MSISPRAVLYLRLSDSKDDSTSLDRQERDLRSLADRRGWDVAEVLTDDGISGRIGRRKADYALQLLADERADVLAVYALDRWTRQGWNGIDKLTTTLDTRAQAGNPAIFVTLRDGLDSSQAAFRLVAGVLSEVARSEAENTAARVRNSIDYRKRHAYKYAGGPGIPFGYRSVPAPDGVGRVLEHEPVEVALLRKIADDILDGGNYLTVARRLAADGVPAARSAARKARQAGADDWTELDHGLWRAATVQRLLTSPSMLGRVKHRGDLVRGPDGLPATVWEPILDRDIYDALVARQRPLKTPRKRADHLLSSVVFCATCGYKMHSTRHTHRGITRRYYICPTNRLEGAARCSVSPAINAQSLEDYISEAVLSIVGDSPEVREVITTEEPAAKAELADVEARLRDLSEAMLDDDADIPALTEELTRLRSRRTELRELPSTERSELVPTGRTIAEAFHAEEQVSRKRALLLTAIDHVEISGTKHTGRRLPPAERAKILWNS